MSSLPRFKAAAVHAAPVFLDKAATTQKVLALIAEAAKNGAELIVFPESFIPAFPVWAALWAPIYNHDLFEAMVENSISVPGPELALIAAAARQHSVFVSIGFTEKNPLSTGGLWNSNVLIGDSGELLNHHRKMVPTFFEKLIWANGDGAGLQVSSTRLGRIGALICGENTNPLARYALIAQGEQVHISNWPPIWPTKPPKEGGNYNNLAANLTRASAHAFEAKAFGIVCAGYMDARMRDFLLDRDAHVAAIIDATPRAASLFVDPTGTQFGPSIQNEEGIVYAELDLNACIEPKQFHDVVGYYNRFDIFDLRVTRERTKAVTWVEGAEQDYSRLIDDV